MTISVTAIEQARRSGDGPDVQRIVFDRMDTVICVTTSGRVGSTVVDAVRDEFARNDAVFGDHRTRAMFDPLPARAMAVDTAGQLLDDAGVADWCISAGGDVLTRGADPVSGRPWAAGIPDPADERRLVSQAVCGPSSRAVSTVTAPAPRARGAAPDSPRQVADVVYQQVSVVSTDAMTAQLLASEILGGGPSMFMLALANWQVEVLAFDTDGRSWGTRAFRSRAMAA